LDSNTYGIIAARQNPVSNPPRSQLPSHNSEGLFFRKNRPVNASATQSLVTILANSDATLGNDINTYMILSDARGNDRVLKRMHNSLPV
jgi:hypothetical protein